MCPAALQQVTLRDMPPLHFLSSHTYLSKTQRADHAFPLATMIWASEESCSGSWQMCCSRYLCGRIPLSPCCEQEPLQHAVPLVHFPGSTSALLMQLILNHGFTETPLSASNRKGHCTQLTHMCPMCVPICAGKHWLVDCCLSELMVEHTALFCMGT